MKHKWFDVIMAAAEGKMIQHLERDGKWSDYTGKNALINLGFYEDQQYRVKPKDMVKKWLWVLGHKTNKGLYISSSYYSENEYPSDYSKFFKVQKIESTMIEVEQD